jgi:hypothetical protein
MRRERGLRHNLDETEQRQPKRRRGSPSAARQQASVVGQDPDCGERRFPGLEAPTLERPLCLARGHPRSRRARCCVDSRSRRRIPSRQYRLHGRCRVAAPPASAPGGVAMITRTPFRDGRGAIRNAPTAGADVEGGTAPARDGKHTPADIVSHVSGEPPPGDPRSRLPARSVSRRETRGRPAVPGRRRPGVIRPGPPSVSGFRNTRRRRQG